MNESAIGRPTSRSPSHGAAAVAIIIGALAWASPAAAQLPILPPRDGARALGGPSMPTYGGYVPYPDLPGGYAPDSRAILGGYSPWGVPEGWLALDYGFGYDDFGPSLLFSEVGPPTGTGYYGTPYRDRVMIGRWGP